VCAECSAATEQDRPVAGVLSVIVSITSSTSSAPLACGDYQYDGR